MDNPNKGGLSRLVAWLRGFSENVETVSEERTNSHSRPRRPSLVADPTHAGLAHAERPNADPMRRGRRDRARAGAVTTNGHHEEPVTEEHAHQMPVERTHTDPVHAEHAEHGHGVSVHEEHGALAHAEHGHGHGHDHGHHAVLVAKGTGGRLELHGNTLHLTKGGVFGFFVTLLGLHGGHAHQTIRVSDISAIEFEKHGLFFHYVRFCYPGAPRESGNHLHDMMADNALLMSVFDNRGLYRIKEQIERSMEAKTS